MQSVMLQTLQGDIASLDVNAKLQSIWTLIIYFIMSLYVNSDGG